MKFLRFALFRLGAIALLSGCWGNEFQAATDGGASSTGREASATFNCVPQACAAGQTCCLGNSPDCTSGTCDTCVTHATCWGDGNCPGTQVCCVHKFPGTACAASVPFAVAQCVTPNASRVCPTNDGHFCDPSGAPCPGVEICSTDSADLSVFVTPTSLPSNVTVGVCK